MNPICDEKICLDEIPMGAAIPKDTIIYMSTAEDPTRCHCQYIFDEVFHIVKRGYPAHIISCNSTKDEISFLMDYPTTGERQRHFCDYSRECAKCKYRFHHEAGYPCEYLIYTEDI